MNWGLVLKYWFYCECWTHGCTTQCCETQCRQNSILTIESGVCVVLTVFARHSSSILNDFAMFAILHWTYNVHVLQEQIGCFSHSVVTLVQSIKLKDSGYERFTMVLQTSCTRQLERQLPWLCKQVIPSHSNVSGQDHGCNMSTLLQLWSAHL